MGRSVARWLWPAPQSRCQWRRVPCGRRTVPAGARRRARLIDKQLSGQRDLRGRAVNTVRTDRFRMTVVNYAAWADHMEAKARLSRATGDPSTSGPGDSTDALSYPEHAARLQHARAHRQRQRDGGLAGARQADLAPTGPIRNVTEDRIAVRLRTRRHQPHPPAPKRSRALRSRPRAKLHSRGDRCRTARRRSQRPALGNSMGKSCADFAFLRLLAPSWGTGLGAQSLGGTPPFAAESSSPNRDAFLQRVVPRVVVEDHGDLLGPLGHVEDRVDPLLHLLVGVDVVEALGDGAAGVPGGSVAAVQAQVGERRGGDLDDRGHDVLGVDARRVDHHPGGVVLAEQLGRGLALAGLGPRAVAELDRGAGGRRGGR